MPFFRFTKIFLIAKCLSSALFSQIIDNEISTCYNLETITSPVSILETSSDKKLTVFFDKLKASGRSVGTSGAMDLTFHYYAQQDSKIILLSFGIDKDLNLSFSKTVDEIWGQKKGTIIYAYDADFVPRSITFAQKKENSKLSVNAYRIKSKSLIEAVPSFNWRRNVDILAYLFETEASQSAAPELRRFIKGNVLIYVLKLKNNAAIVIYDSERNGILGAVKLSSGKPSFLAVDNQSENEYLITWSSEDKNFSSAKRYAVSWDLVENTRDCDRH